MIAGRVLGALGSVVDWSLIHLLGVVSDRVEGRRADCYRRADQLADIEAGRDHLEPGDLAGGYPISSLTSDIDWGGTETARLNRDAMQALQDALVRPDPAVHGFSGECPATSRSCEHEGPTWSCAECGKVMHTITAAGSPTKRGLFCSAKCAADAPEIELDRIAPESLAAMINMQSASPVRSAAVTIPAADNTPDCGCGSGTKCPDPITCPDAVTAAMDEDTAAADGTDLYDSIVALFDYHDITRNPTVDYLWRCDGCNWKGNQRRDHTLHRLALVADMKNATERIQEQLAESTNACVVDGCDFWWHTYEQLNSHSRQMHLEPNPLPAGGFRYPGADHVGDFTWHHVPTHRIQEQLGGAS